MTDTDTTDTPTTGADFEAFCKSIQSVKVISVIYALTTLYFASFHFSILYLFI